MGKGERSEEAIVSTISALSFHNLESFFHSWFSDFEVKMRCSYLLFVSQIELVQAENYKSEELITRACMILEAIYNN